MNKSKNSNLVNIWQYPSHIYPLIHVERKKNTLEMETTLRKKHKGQYYLWRFYRSAYVPNYKNDYTSAISSFNRDIYLCLLKGKVQPELTLSDGTYIYLLDINQQSEIKRLTPKKS